MKTAIDTGQRRNKAALAKRLTELRLLATYYLTAISIAPRCSVLGT